MTANATNRRKRADAASNARSASAKARLRGMNSVGWAALYDYARGRAWWVTDGTIAALHRRGYLVDGTVTHKGYLALMGRRRDPIADRSDAEVVGFYLAMHDAPAWPAEGQ